MTSKTSKLVATIILAALFIVPNLRAQATVDEAKQALKNAEKNLKVATKAAKKAESAVKDASSTLNSVDKELTKINKELAGLQEKLQSATEKNKPVVQSKIATANNKLAAANAKKENATQALADAKANAAQAQATAATADKAVADAKAALTAAKNAEKNAKDAAKTAAKDAAKTGEKDAKTAEKEAKEAAKNAKAKEKAAAKAEKEARKNEPVVLPWTPEPQHKLPMLQGDQKLTVPEAKVADIVAADTPLPQFDIAMVSGDRKIVEKLPVWNAWKEYVEFNKVTPKDINEFHGKLIKALQEEGYVFAQVEFPTKIWSTGIFLAKVDCGQLGDITVKNQKHYSAKQIVRALENKEGRFNYANVHSDLFDLNAKPDLKLQTSLKPIQQGGRRIINAEIEVDDKLPVHGSIEASNSAAKDARNDWRIRTTLQHLNITKHNDSLTFDWLTTGRIGEDMNALSLSYFLPITEDLSFNIYGGWSSNYTDEVLPEISVRGRGAFGGLQFTYTFYETMRDRLQLSAGWFYQRITNYQDVETDTGSVRFDNGDITISMPTITLGYTQKIFDSLHGRNFASITLQQNRAGTFGSTSSRGFVAASGTDGDFTVAKIQLARFQRLFAGKDAPGKWTLFAKFDAQLASDRMPTITREYLGGRNSVRGYEESEVNGDHAFVGTLELRTPLIENFIPGLKKDTQYVKDNPEYWQQHRLQFLLFSDFGYVAYDDKTSGADDQGLISVGAGFRLGLTKYSQMSLDYGYPILDASEDTPDAGRFHVSLQLQF